MLTTGFDHSRVSWHQIEGIDHIWYHVFNVDEEARIVDILFKMEPNKKIVPHRHHSDYYTLVLQGELRIYSLDGDLIEIRPTGSYVGTRGGGAPHTEGAGDDWTIAFFSNRNVGTMIYEVLDENQDTLATLGPAEFKELWMAQEPEPTTKVAQSTMA